MLKGHTPQNTVIVADFDRTITTGEPGCVSAFGVFPRAPKSSPEIQLRAKELFNTYYPIEIDPSISETERSKYMKEWNERVMDLLGECVDENQMQRILNYAKQKIVIRKGIKDSLQTSGDLGIPLIVISAGVSNVIQEVLHHNNIPFHGLHSNLLGFRSERLQLVNEGVYIGYKGWDSLPGTISGGLSTRTHEIILGDSIDDLNMGDDGKITTSIGFLNSEQREKGREQDYRSAFDYVIESDTSDDGILKELLTELQAATYNP